MEDELTLPPVKTILTAVVISIVLFACVFLAYTSIRSRQSQIILPGGITYLGPSPSPTAPPATPNGKIPVPDTATWSTNKGKRYPYAFAYPVTLSLGWFPNDPYDAVTVFYQGTDANANIFFRVDDLTKLKKTQYSGNTLGYAQNWWKDYNWKGVAAVTEFTNSGGLRGYRAKYLNSDNVTPYDHVFFEVPRNPNLVIWISGKLFTQNIFDRIVNSVSWTK